MRWYLTFKLSSRDLVQMMAERGIGLAHTTILRWVQRYVPDFEKRWNQYARVVGDSWRVDGKCCKFVVEPNVGVEIDNLARRREQTENEAVQ